MAKRLMRLYVWQEVLCDYTCGMIVALAPDMETALALARAHALSYAAPEAMGETEPQVTELGRIDCEPKLWAVYGGG